MLKSLWNVHSYQQLFTQTQMIRHFENPRRDVIIATWYERKFLFRDIHVRDLLHVIFLLIEVLIKQSTILWLKLQHLFIIGLYLSVYRRRAVTRS